MKILQVYPHFANCKGGVERYIDGLSTNLSRKGHSVTIIPLEENSYRLLCNHVELKKSNVISRLSTILCEDFDVIHTHGFRVPYSALMGLIRKVRHDRVIMTVHTFFPSYSTFDYMAKCGYDITIGKAILKTFNGFITLHNDLSRQLQVLGVQKERIFCIPNSVDFNRFHEVPSENEFIEKIGISPQEDIILFVGRIDWQKGLDTTVKEFAKVYKKNKNAVLIIIGKDFGYKDQLQEVARRSGVYSRVIFTGVVSDKILYSAYKAAKVLIMTSIYEGLPTVLLEAMALGLPVISTPLKGVSEVLSAHDGVIWCQKDQFADKICEILSSDTLRKDLSIGARAAVRRDFDWDKNANKILEVYTSV